ncbi:MAG: hypothetical protein K0S32_1558 [Bacteroidetes bacterium]|nr:hypothetical protein [Bacteroidota bacterium]
MIRPSDAAEKKLQEDSKLQYNHKVGVTGKGFFQKLLEWLSEKFFDNVEYDSIDITRRIIIWTLIIISVVIVIWLLLKSDMVGLIRPKAKAASFNFSDVTEDLDSINFNQRINDALTNNDYRLALRWQYLKVLYLLDKKQLIVFAPFKTNIDYKNELKNKNLQEKFMSLSRTYEYVWYGQFAFNSTLYNNSAAEFESIEKEINV